MKQLLTPFENIDDLVCVKHADDGEIALQALETTGQVENDFITVLFISLQRGLKCSQQGFDPTGEVGDAGRIEARGNEKLHVLDALLLPEEMLHDLSGLASQSGVAMRMWISRWASM